jgi:hypothetical protein
MNRFAHDHLYHELTIACFEGYCKSRSAIQMFNAVLLTPYDGRNTGMKHETLFSQVRTSISTDHIRQFAYGIFDVFIYFIVINSEKPAHNCTNTRFSKRKCHAAGGVAAYRDQCRNCTDGKFVPLDKRFARDGFDHSHCCQDLYRPG